MTAATMAGPIALTERAQGHIAQLCTNLYVSAEKVPKCLALTAAGHQEGKTSLGLALAIQVGQLFDAEVVFVEGNLRNPSLADLVGLDRGREGLAECLAGAAQPDGVAVDLGDGLPHVIPAGNARDQKTITKCLDKENVAALFGTLAQRYRHVIVEAPAVNMYPEAQVLIGQADQVVLVVHAGVTTREAAALAVRRIEQCGAPAPAVVLNRKRLHVPEFLYKRL